MHKTYNPSTIYAPLANYSHAVACSNELLLLSGQLGIAPDGSLPKTVFEQAVQCFTNIDSILSEAGLGIENVVKISAYVTDRSDLKPYMKARDEWIGELMAPPASTLMVVSGFAKPEMKVEIEVTASR